MENLSLENIINLSKNFEKDLNGIYFLLNKNEIVYVGQTTQGLTRTFCHAKNKIFDKYYFIPCPADKLDYIESAYIIKFNPIYNKTINKGSKSINSLKLFLRRMNVSPEFHDKRYLIKLIRKLGYEPQKYLNQYYINEECFNKISKVLLGF